MTNFDEDFNFRSGDWGVLRDKLENDLANSYELLASKGCSNDASNILRGRILYIKSILASAQAAANRSR